MKLIHLLADWENCLFHVGTTRVACRATSHIEGNTWCGTCIAWHIKIVQLRESYRDVGRDLLQLLVLVELNAISLRKILKKFDKRFGYRFADYYVKTRANHPYSQSPYNAWSSNRKAACYLSPCLWRVSVQWVLRYNDLQRLMSFSAS